MRDTGGVTVLHDARTRDFASDNYAGAHPEVLEAIVAANGGHQGAYGADAYTEALQDVMRGHFGPEAVTFPVFNGTGANVVALQAMLPRWGAVICTTTAHVHVDEGGAPERVGGTKLLPVPTEDGKLTPELVDREAWGFGDEHRAQPAVVAITQSTELGTRYEPAEIKELVEHAHSLGMKVYVDGARLANAAAGLGVGLGETTTALGVDVVGLGGTKNGLLGAEAIVVANPELAEAITYLRKADMQLGSKMRFLSAQLLALFSGDLWLRSAQHANAMAARLRAGVEGLEGVHVTQATQANAVFATLPEGVADRLRERFRFYDWDAARREVRWMCSFDTTPGDVDEFVGALTEVLATR